MICSSYCVCILKDIKSICFLPPLFTELLLGSIQGQEIAMEVSIQVISDFPVSSFRVVCLECWKPATRASAVFKDGANIPRLIAISLKNEGA